MVPAVWYGERRRMSACVRKPCTSKTAAGLPIQGQCFADLKTRVGEGEGNMIPDSYPLVGPP